MIYITQIIYIKPGFESVFDEFETVAIPSIDRYNGKLLFRLRPNKESVIESNLMEIPYEVHLVQFASEKDFENFKQDKERARFLHLKEKSVREILLIKGNEL